jgi:HEAT repeat protein
VGEGPADVAAHSPTTLILSPHSTADSQRAIVPIEVASQLKLSDQVVNQLEGVSQTGSLLNLEGIVAKLNTREEVVMNSPLVTYLHDHLAGARFAIDLLEELYRQEVDSDVARAAATLLTEIKEDRSILENYLNTLNHDESLLKDVAAWVAQKAGRLKLDLDDPFGLFEAVEILSLGVLGKLALWNALRALRNAGEPVEGLDLDGLIGRAREQHQQLEMLRISLAVRVLAMQSEDRR